MRELFIYRREIKIKELPVVKYIPEFRAHNMLVGSSSGEHLYNGLVDELRAMPESGIAVLDFQGVGLGSPAAFESLIRLKRDFPEGATPYIALKNFSESSLESLLMVTASKLVVARNLIFPIYRPFGLNETVQLTGRIENHLRACIDYVIEQGSSTSAEMAEHYGWKKHTDLWLN